MSRVQEHMAGQGHGEEAEPALSAASGGPPPMGGRARARGMGRTIITEQQDRFREAKSTLLHVSLLPSLSETDAGMGKQMPQDLEEESRTRASLDHHGDACTMGHVCRANQGPGSLRA